MQPRRARQRNAWLWFHLGSLVLLSGVGGYVWGGEPLAFMVALAVLWSINVVALGLWLHRGH